jgi:hypothetical protein
MDIRRHDEGIRPEEVMQAVRSCNEGATIYMCLCTCTHP